MGTFKEAKTLFDALAAHEKTVKIADSWAGLNVEARGFHGAMVEAWGAVKAALLATDAETVSKVRRHLRPVLEESLRRAEFSVGLRDRS